MNIVASNRNRLHTSPRAIRPGFTIVELLVVLSILMLLMTIVAPSITRAKKLALITKCAAHLHQTGATLIQYHADNMRFPPVYRRHTGNPLDNPISGTTLYRATNYDLRDYVREYADFTVWDCPATGPRLTNEGYNAIPGKRYFYFTYSYFPGRKNPDFGISSRAPERLSQVREPRPMMQDQVRDHRHLNRGIWTNHRSSGRFTPESMAEVDGINLLQYDMGVRWVNAGELVVVGNDLGHIPNWSVMP